MALRFQDRDDDVDQAAKLGVGVLVFMLVLVAVSNRAYAWFSGQSFASYGKDLVWVSFLYVFWIGFRLYHEFRTRTKEIDGKYLRLKRQ